MVTIKQLCYFPSSITNQKVIVNIASIKKITNIFLTFFGEKNIGYHFFLSIMHNLKFKFSFMW